MQGKKKARKKNSKQERAPGSPGITPPGEHVSPHEESPVFLLSPHALLDEAVSKATRTLIDASNGVDVSREQLAAAQDILNRKGITSGGMKTSQIPEDFARFAFSYVFKILGFGEITWPKTLVPVVSREEETEAASSAFQEALLDS